MQRALELLKTRFGHDAFRPGQEEVVGRILSGSSAAAIFPTGAGKSLCYQLPAVVLPHVTLVVSPLLSLMQDQLDALRRTGIAAARLDSTLSRDEYAETIAQAVSGELKVLMISVERFRNERFRSSLARMKISLLVVDEAHCISEWGHNFRPDYQKLPLYAKEFCIPQVLLLTATATPRVLADMVGRFGMPLGHATTTGFHRPNLHVRVTAVAGRERDMLLRQRMEIDTEAATIVYATRQQTAEHCAKLLQGVGIRAAYYHAGMDNDERMRVQQEFIAGNIRCVCATIAFGMGIDKSDIRRVIHYDLPRSLEGYSQEIGRAGRDGAVAACEIFACRDTVSILENFVYGDTPSREGIQWVLEDIAKNEGAIWETRLTALSNASDLRPLPLKTLLVLLEMDGIIEPQQTWFETYSFKYHSKAGEIVALFSDERKKFMEALLAKCTTRSTWTGVDVEGMIQGYGCNRQRIVAALEWLDEKGHIELAASQSVDSYRILRPDFSVAETLDRIHDLFMKKETHEIERIGAMIAFLEQEACLSGALAGYFGEDLGVFRCGTCSFCRSGKVMLPASSALPIVAEEDVSGYLGLLAERLKKPIDARTAAKFLCGMTSPLFTRAKARSLRGFGMLEEYPFKEVCAIAAGCLKSR